MITNSKTGITRRNFIVESAALVAGAQLTASAKSRANATAGLPLGISTPSPL
jgi:hypothetical protein